MFEGKSEATLFLAHISPSCVLSISLITEEGKTFSYQNLSLSLKFLNVWPTIWAPNYPNIAPLRGL
jgi:hypothetical protein